MKSAVSSDFLKVFAVFVEDLGNVRKFFEKIKDFEPLTPLTPVFKHLLSFLLKILVFSRKVGLNCLHQACSVDYLPIVEVFFNEILSFSEGFRGNSFSFW